MPQETGTYTKHALKGTYLDEISLSGLFVRSKIPPLQKSLANNYITIRKIFSYNTVQPRITNVELNILAQNGLYPLEDTSEDRMLAELSRVLELANSGNRELVEKSEKIFTIRVKELKYILANVSPMKQYEFKGGFRILEKYLEFIAW